MITIPRKMALAGVAAIAVLVLYLGWNTYYNVGALQRSDRAAADRAEVQTTSNETLSRIATLQEGLCQYADTNQDFALLVTDLLAADGVADEFDPEIRARVAQVLQALKALDDLDGCQPPG